VVFDKTGTLTEGKPTVVATARFEQRGLWAIVISEGPSSSEALELAAALARHSNHPLSQAVARLAVADHAFSEWHEFGGAGLAGKASINDGPLKTIRLGSLRWLREIGVDLSVGERFAEVSTERGATVLGVAVDQSLAAMIAIVDTVKPGARQVVRQLSRQGLETYLLTGDNRRTAVSIARQAGIPSENVFADVRPEGKAAFVQRLQNREQRVAFVGDGINDAPALEQADLGIAVSRASDIAREAADVILLNSELDAVPESLGLARATLRTIKQNLFWAFFYNAIGVPLAALGFMSPVLCAAAMGLSDLIVIGNALRLRHWKLSA
jgi:Cu+-exporting ATPase